MKLIPFLFSLILVLPTSLTAQSNPPEIILQEGDYTDLQDIVYTADGSRVAGLTQDSELSGLQVIVWDVRSGRTIARVQLESKVFAWNENIRSLAISPEGRYVAVAQKRNIHIYDLSEPTMEAIVDRQTKVELQKFKPRHLAFSPDGRYFVVADDEIARFSVSGSPEEWPVERFGKDRNINSMEISGDGHYLALGRKGRDLEIWSLPDKSELRLLEKAPQQVDLVSLSDEGRYIAASPEKRRLMLWEVESGRLIQDWKADHPVNMLRFAPDGQTLVTSHPETDHLSIWEIPSGRLQKEIPNVVNPLAKNTALSFSPQGRYLAVSDFKLKNDPNQEEKEKKKSKRSRGFEILSYPDGRLVREINLQDPLPVYSLNLNEDATQLVSYGADGFLKVWDLAAADLITAEKMPEELEKLQFTTDLKHVAYRYPDRVEIGPFDPGRPHAERQIRYRLRASDYDLSSLVFSIEKRHLACIARDSSIHIWPMDESGRSRPTVIRLPKKEFVRFIQLSRDARYLAGGRDSTFFIWSTADQRLLHDKEVVPLRERGISTEIVQFAPSTDGETFFVNCKEKYVGKTFGTKITQDGATTLKFNARTGEKDLIPDNLGVGLIESIFKVTTSIFLVEPFAISGDGQKYAMGESPVFRSNLIRGSADPSKKVYVGDLANLSTKRMFEVDIGNTEIQAVAVNNDGRFLATGSNDGLIKLWNTEEQKLIAEIIHRAGEYAFLLRQNPMEPYYKMSKGADELVAFRLGKNIYPFEAFDLQFNRHDKVLEALSDPQSGIIDRTEDVEALIRGFYRAYEKRRAKMGYTATAGSWKQPPNSVVIENLADLPIETPEREISLQVHATDDQHPLRNIKVWINDVPVFGRNGRPVAEEGARSSRMSFDLTLSAGINKIQVASTNDQQVESLLETIYITYNGPSEKPDLHIVAIGVTEYQNQAMNLFYPVKDATDFLNMYRSQRERYGQLHIHRLMNQEATVEKIQALKETLQKTRVDDQVILFYAGHGLVDEQLDYYLATYDTDFGNPSRRGLAYESLEALIDEIPARNKVIIIDACHSGEIDKESVEKIKERRTEEGEVNFRSVDSGIAYRQMGLENSFELMKELFLDLRRGVGATVISSASGVEFAMEGDQWRNGVFTYCLLQGLGQQKADQNGDGRVMISELQDYLSREVPALTDNNQRPTSRVENIANDFCLWKK